MEKAVCIDKDPVASTSPMQDHRKRKKDVDMTENEDPASANLGMKWSQDEQEVSMMTRLGEGDGDSDKVEVTFTDQQMTIKLSDGRQQRWCFHGAIEKDQSRVQCKKRKFTIKVVKKEAGLWPSLEAPEGTMAAGETSNQDNDRDMSPDNEPADTLQEVRTKEEEPVLELQHVKRDFFERGENLTVHIYVKNVSKDAVKIHFDKQSFTVKFQTSDVKFLQLHEGASEETVFCWKVNTKNPIYPAACRYKITATFIELSLKKVSAERWATLEAPLRKETASASKSTSWMPAAGSASTAAAPGASTVAFDEMSQIDVNRRDSELADMPASAQLGSTSFKSQKPTAKVQPLNKQQVDVPVVQPGFTGLDNLGNTCFMNSVIQVLSNTREFRDFFLDGSFQAEINSDNVLGTGGHLAVSFGVLLKMLWKGTHYSCAPSKLKELVSQKANQFMGFAQHDAQEFLAFLLDGLHEDLNRVKDKPYTAAVEDDGRPDHAVADEAWAVYKQRNDSFVVDLLQGQYKSKLVCPVCNKVSITFDPFLYLSVPLPKRKKVLTVTFMWRDPHRKPIKYTVQLVKDSSVQHLKEVLARKTGVQTSNMRVFEVYRSLFHKRFANSSDLASVLPSDMIVVSEVLSPEMAGEEVVEVDVIQRTLMAHQYPMRCSACHKECKEGIKLRRCTKCLKVGYCDQTCQRTHWQTHRSQCSMAPEPVGCPFILSLPRSHCTYSRIARLMESFARYSVDTFQPPVQTDPQTSTTTATSTTTTAITTTTATTSASNSATTSSAMLPPGGDLQLPSHTSASNLSSSSGSQSSGSLSSLDSISSCSSTATLTAETPHATFNISHSGEEEDEGKEEDESKESGLDERGGGDVDSAFGSLSSGQGGVTPQAPGCSTAEGDLGQEAGADRDAAAPSSAEKSSLGNHVQSVAANVATERSIPLFFIKPVTTDGRGVRDLGRLDDRGETPLDMSSYRCLSMDWRNSEKLASYVLVQSKVLETDLDESTQTGSQYESDNMSLYECLELFTEPEILAPNEAWYCPSCKEQREASKQMSVWRLPHTLVIQLKRFSFRNALWRDKIDKLVEFPIRGLDMSRFAMGAHRPGDPAPIYDLYGVVNHHGGILGGHYTSYARCADLTVPFKNEVGWRLFDDSRVTTVSSEKNVQTRAAYLLFYRLHEPFKPPVRRLMATSAEKEEEDEAVKDKTEEMPLWSSDEVRTEVGGKECLDEKHDSDKDEDESDSHNEESQGRLVIDMDCPPPRLDYTDMDAVD